MKRNTERQRSRYQIGEKINQQFVVLEDARLGGMGEVYKCRDEASGGIVAVKTLQHDRRRSRVLHDLFKQEAQNWLKLGKHKNIVSFHSAVYSHSNLCLASEWIEPDEHGRTNLNDWLRNGPLSLELALDLAMDVCAGLLHAQVKVPGIVHRDLKPSNLLVGWTTFREGLRLHSTDQHEVAIAMQNSQWVRAQVAKINDWGLGKVAIEAERREVWPRRSNKVGTWLYMAPEQWNGWHADARTDIYALGCILFQMLVGRPPYIGSTPDALMKSHTHQPIPTLPATMPQRHSLQGIVARCIAKYPDDRYPDVSYLLSDLDEMYQRQFTKRPRALESDIVIYLPGDLCNRGSAYIAFEQYEEALKCFNEALRIDPGLSHAHAGCGAVHFRRGNYVEALAALDVAIQLDPNVPCFYSNRGAVNRHLKKHADALRDFANAIALVPNDLYAYTNRGNLYVDLGEYDKAVQDYNHAITLGPGEAELYYARSVVYSQVGRTDLAIQDLTAAIQCEPMNWKYHLRRADIFAELGQYQTAVKDCTTAIECDPNCIRAFRLRAYVYSQLGAKEKAERDWHMAARIEVRGDNINAGSNAEMESFEDLSAQGRLLLERGDHQRAVELLTRAIALRSDAVDVLAERAISFAELGEHHKAIADYSRVIQVDSSREHVYYGRAASYLKLNYLNEALADFDIAISQAPSDKDCYFARAMCLERLGRLELAEQDYTTVIERAPDNPRAYHNRGVLRQKMGKEDIALADCLWAYHLDPQDADYCFGVATIYYNRGQLQEAAPYFEQAFWLGDEEAGAVALQLRERLGYKPAPNRDPARASFELFLNANSRLEMQRAVLHCPFMATKTFLNLIRDEATGTSRLREDAGRRLAWLSELIDLQEDNYDGL